MRAALSEVFGNRWPYMPNVMAHFCMAKTSAGRYWGHAFRNKLARVEMPKSMQPDFRQLQVQHIAIPLPRGLARATQAAVPFGED